MNLAESKVGTRAIYQPGASSIEGLPTALQMFHAHPPIMAMPHWHAQVEVNYVMRGTVHYRMSDHEFRLSAGEMCLFWGGQPHQMDESSDDSLYAGAHLPLVYFFRLRLPISVSSRLMKGETLLTSATDAADNENFTRWFRYANSGDAAKAQHAVDELLLRIERIALEPYSMTSQAVISLEGDHPHPHSSRSVARMCDFIAANFLHDIDSVDIARAADLHPKYAMNLFKRSTGMTLSKYVTLLRLSRAQAMLMSEGANVLQVAMDSGFGSISAFNKSFRHIAGMSPSDFRRDIRLVTTVPAGAFRN
ncbi:helix-turn-helix domain-containing protein [Rhizobium leguminosarum]|uniref:helix-turn-helix domain-containing protein n=1 Tax=Rhizobium leguminosarum TaxID=384 RepID=UPI00037CD56C|nr:helix-turn-helix domain-containing protein [Rhizobium leguminosarum]MBY5753406.1 helix-turn-helix domain-containing protein [Rhizobium leguminosarum]MBY5781665.1 helix-turn-helix domain-containing protein [Rhizobium leguminosarum]MBY5826112.1 helix-turn-helix domain-containing protein [Rhizobium leguminosarum]TBY74871.1 helix-turn-helix domain-containing protein [Rhizobium leguminosarum bv. viciae]TBZ10044.1 helix-turn-helix domain-containing protein [Rhizobium leguminosarum bv. viciae]